MKQEDRRNTFQAFKTEKSALLLSTDIAARGLDFPKVRCIVQYDSPGEATEYVHRFLGTYFSCGYMHIFSSQLYLCFC
jgi:ATP-dependent RNA helicase DDX31/DBP7